MDLMSYIDRGGIIVYILIAMNFIGFTIMFWKIFTLIIANNNIEKTCDQITQNLSSKDITYVKSLISLHIKKLEIGLDTVKIIASLSPLIGLLGTVVGILHSFDSITHMGLGDPTVFSSGISVALITTVAGLVVAIPHYMGYNYIISFLDSLEIKMEKSILEKI